MRVDLLPHFLEHLNDLLELIDYFNDFFMVFTVFTDIVWNRIEN